MKRWLLWAFVCRRGRRCPNLVIDDSKAEGVPPGSILRLGYECGTCGTVYEGSFLVGQDNGLVAGGRERLTGSRLVFAQSGISVPGGGRATFFGTAGPAEDDEDA